ncbi:ThiF family adenylyltransferase [Paenarthrobacter sp. DKR-5]|uniref:ThiF family adenylyltransferase n=1 Tax=Paenarthrobacter sp. DKR-5 TaxID=2835535 RepID=UPI001BDD322B|nr:ThiF family adenylyltransferase [Paenarthrobacter sp. DKR-5]MBT1002955.1 ThiF family adenylyltransferase [Paenarthrobacter sp. DKR-5]
MRLNPGLRTVLRRPDSLQLGSTSGGIVVEGLSAPARAFIDRLRDGFPDTELAEVAAGCGLEEPEAEELLAALGDAVFPSGTNPAQPVGPAAERARADAAHWSAVYRRDGAAVLRRRAAASVCVTGLGRTGAALAQHLASAGVGTILLDDPRPVLPKDLGAASFGPAELGMPRAAAVRRRLAQLAPAVSARIRHPGAPLPSRAAPGLEVIVGSEVVPAAERERLLASGRPHLAVLLREQDSIVGPLVVPGATACLDCIERQRADADEAWPAVAEQLARDAGSGEESALAAATAGLAALQVLLHLDGLHRPATWSAVLRLRSADGAPSLEPCAPHPRCWCRFQLAASVPRISSTASP